MQQPNLSSIQARGAARKARATRTTTPRFKTRPKEFYEREDKKHKEKLEKYLGKQEPNLSLARFRALSYDLKVVETILDQIHRYYDSFAGPQWTRKFPSSPRTTMKEMILCVDLGEAFPRGEETPIHPTQLFSRYVVAVELLKSNSPAEQSEGWRLIFEAFALFKPILEQQHTQLLRYFFQQVWDYRLDDHPEIRERIFDIAYKMSYTTLGKQHPITMICYLLPKVEDKREVCVLAWQKSLELIDVNLGVASDDSLRSKLAFAGDLIEQSKFLEAENLLKKMLRVEERQPTDYYMRSALLRLAWLYRAQNRHAEAENALYEVLRRCRENDRYGQADRDAIYIAAQTNLAQSLSSRQDFQESAKVLEATWRDCAQTYGLEHRYTTSVADELDKIQRTMANTHI